MILRLIPFPNKKAYRCKESDDADEGREMAYGSWFRIHHAYFYLLVLHEEPSWWRHASKYDYWKELNWVNKYLSIKQHKYLIKFRHWNLDLNDTVYLPKRIFWWQLLDALHRSMDPVVLQPWHRQTLLLNLPDPSHDLTPLL